MSGRSEVAARLDDAYGRRLLHIAQLRMIVGFLGEKAQYGWWSSEFFSASASAFLTPVFGKTSLLAKYHGVKEAARRVHDEHIGVGHVFHLFRLPESMEQALFEVLQDSATADALHLDLASSTAAVAALREVAGSSGLLREGPTQIGVATDLAESYWLPEVARGYAAAFEAGSRSYPYFVGQS